jgi:serine protease Do
MMSERGIRNLGRTALAAAVVLGLSAVSAAAGMDEVSTEAIAKKVFPSVVKVEAHDGMSRVATGVVIGKDGYIVTTALISPRDEDLFVTTADGSRGEAKFLGWDPETRLALLQAKEKGLTPISLAKAGELSAGSWIGVVSMSPENSPALTQGIVSSSAPDRLRLNVWVTRGASGSPVVNKEGQMVALLRGIYTEDRPVLFEFREKEVVGSGYVFDRAEAPSSGMAVGIPVDIVKSIADEIKETGKVSRPWMGVSIAENEKGQVKIDNLEPDSPADLAKLKEGDLLSAIDGKKITSGQMFVSEIRRRKPGQDVDLRVERDGKPVSAKVKLAEYPEVEAKRALEAQFPRLFPPMPPKPGEAPGPPEGFEGWRAAGPPRVPGGLPAWQKRKYVGLYLEPMTNELLDYFGVKEGPGLLVNRLTDDGPAAKAGLKVGDVILRVDGRKVESVSDLSELIQDKKAGDKVKFEIIREKKPMTVELEIAEEEGPGVSEFFRSMPSIDDWAALGGDFLREFERNREAYESYSSEQREQLKKLTGELAVKARNSKELAKEQAARSKAEAEKLLKTVKAKSQKLDRV